MRFLIESTRFLRQEKGQGMVEYGLIIALVAVAVVLTLTLLGGQIADIFSSITTTLDNSTAP